MAEALKDQAGCVDKSFQMTSADAASTFITGMAQFIRHNALGAVAVAFSGGVLAGWLIAHDLKTRLYASEQRQRKAGEAKAYKRAISRWEGEGGAIRSTMKGNKK
jgi:hypothetical protein